MKLSIMRLRLGLVWLFGLLAGGGAALTVGALYTTKPGLAIVIPVAAFLLGTILGGWTIRNVASSFDALKARK